MLSYISRSTAETEAIAKDFALKLLPGDVIAYKGNLGAGKTAFTRGLAAGLSLDCEVTSPTFALVHEYRGKPLSLFHFDMYRIETMQDLYATGFFDYLEENQVLAVEWSENIETVLESEGNIIYITLEVLGDNERKITIEGCGRF